MESNKVERLLERYFEGETDLSEEKVLRTYFTSGEVAPHLQAYVGLFSAFAKAQEDTFELPIEIPSKGRNTTWLVSAVAIVLVCIGFLIQQQASEQTVSGDFKDNPEMAVLKAKQSLLLVSKMINQSTSQLGAVKAFDNAPSPFFK